MAEKRNRESGPPHGWALLAATGLLLTATTPARAGSTERVSVSSNGKQADSNSSRPSISADGRFIVFYSQADNLVSGDTNGNCFPRHICGSDAFVRDRLKGTTERVSVGPNGRQGDERSGTDGLSISADGRFVAFESAATNLVPDDNGFGIYAHDRETGRTERIDLGPHRVRANSLSSFPSISAHGRFVAFGSYATNLVPGDDGSVTYDVFVRDRERGTTEQVSVSSNGKQGDADSGAYAVLSISADGRFVAFASNATNLVPGDTNGCSPDFCGTDVFVRDRQRGTTERVSLGPRRLQGDGPSGAYGEAISGNGRFVTFQSFATNLVPGDTGGGVYVRDRQLGTTERVDRGLHGRQANGGSGEPALSADGRLVVFASEASNLVPGDTNAECDAEDYCDADVFVRTR